MFAIYMGCTKIYLVGMDCDYGHFYPSITRNEGNFTNLVNGWRLIEKYLNEHLPSIDVTVLNPIGLKDIFK